MGLGGLVSGVAGGLSALDPTGTIAGVTSGYGAYQQQKSSENMAQDQMDFQGDQAQIARRYQRRMSNTAVRRNVRDMQKAGLNPILAAGGGASTPSSPSPAGAMGTATNPGEAATSALNASRLTSAQIGKIRADTAMTREQTKAIQPVANLGESIDELYNYIRGALPSSAKQVQSAVNNAEQQKSTVTHKVPPMKTLPDKPLPSSSKTSGPYYHTERMKIGSNSFKVLVRGHGDTKQYAIPSRPNKWYTRKQLEAMK